MQFIEVGDGKLYYEVAGEGEPLVLVHAGFVDSRMWDAQWQAFKAHFRVVRFDMLGYGRSDKVTQPVSRRAHLARLLDALNIQRAHLLGCSMGGEIILDFALEHRDRALSLIPVSAVPGGFEMQGEPPALMMEMIGALQAGDLDRAADLQIRLWIDGEQRQPGQVDPAVRQQAAMMNRIFIQNGTWTYDMQPLHPLDPPAATQLHELTMPALVIAGALDHPEIVRASDVMASQLPNARKRIMEGCAHLPSMEKPDEFNRAVLEFLGVR
jgi:pimeloyl-ACP methyl ester carboxylesterase